MPLTDLTTVELERIARHMLRRYLDVRAGVLPPRALAPALGPVTGSATSLDVLTGAGGEAAVGHAHLGPVTVLRLGPSHAYAAAAVTRTARRVDVVSVELEGQGERVMAVRIGEAEVLRPDVTRGTGARPDAARVGPGQPVPAAPPHLVGLLGKVPADPDRLERWASAAAVIDVYRETYAVDDPRSAFGAAPTNSEQAQARDRAVQYVRAIAAGLAIEPEQQHGVSRDPADRDLGR